MHKTATPQINCLPRRLEEMDKAAEGWLINKVLNMMCDGLVAAYVASKELSLNSGKIKQDLKYTSGLLQEAQARGVGNNNSLDQLVQELSAKAHEAEDPLDELHYFIIQDQLDGTQYAVQDLGDDLRGFARHGHHALRHILGNCVACFSCSRKRDDGADVTNNSHNSTNFSSGNHGVVDNLPFERVAMSKKIKSVIEEIHSLCQRVSELLIITSNHSVTGTITLTRPLVGSTVVQEKLYGRTAIFEKTIKDITNVTYQGDPFSVLPIVGPGGIGKTTFTQHLYNDKRIEEHFSVRVWVCVSTNFDVLKLTQEIHSCIPAFEKEETNITNGTTNLDQLQISIAHRLKYKRFLVVLDDIWKCDTDAEWKTLLAPFTKGVTKGSMLIVTTRFPKIEGRVRQATIPVNLQGLEPKEFLEFFKECVFGNEKPNQQYSELIGSGREIAEKLKCSPVAATTVARLLKKDLSWEHWRKVLDSNEWKNETSDDDIMPALKISYDYLPFHLKQCFLYLSLFPEDHRFTNLEIIHCLTAIGIIDSSYKNKNYIQELVDNGFLLKSEECYVMHDLLHELSRSVSSHECFNISSGLSFTAEGIPQSIHHLSITMEDRYDKKFRSEMAKLKSRINIRNLRTLMIFREYQTQIVGILDETFEEIEGLRVLFIVMNSPDSLPKGFSKLVHLRYLKIRSPSGFQVSLPTTLPRFYHLIFLDLQYWNGSSCLPKYISRLVNLRHFIANPELHSNVPEVGKMEHLEELSKFVVKKESVGFELEELGKLPNLGGELGIYNLDEVATKEEAKEENLDLKSNLKSLILFWRHRYSAIGVDVVDGLQPHDDLRELTIIDHGGAIGPPSWLWNDIPIKLLERLELVGVSWGTLPSLTQLNYLKKLVLQSVSRVRIIGPDLSFMHLKEVEFSYMEDLEKWIMGPNCHSFPMLESITCNGCPEFVEMPFWSEVLGPRTEDIHYPTLFTLDTSGCPKLSLPPMPHTSTLTFVSAGDDPCSLGSAAQRMNYKKNRLTLERHSGALAFHNMDKLEAISSLDGTEIQWTQLQKVTSLREVDIRKDLSMLSIGFLSYSKSLRRLVLVDCTNLTLEGFNPLITVNLETLIIYNHLPRGARSIATKLLSELVVFKTKQLLPAGTFHRLKTLEVDSISVVLVAPICTLLAATLDTLSFYFDERMESLTTEEEKALQLLTSLQTLNFVGCPGLPSLPQGLHTSCSLRELDVIVCSEIRSLPKGGLPTSLQVLMISGCTAELYEQANELKGMNPNFRVTLY